MSNRIAGIAFLKVDGRQYPLRGNFTVSVSAVERTGIPGMESVHGYAENPRVPFIEGDVSLTPDLSIEELEAITDATVQADLANGRSYVLQNAWCKSAFELNAKEGQTKVRFEGLNGFEVA